MDFKRVDAKPDIKLKSAENELYPTDLQMYLDPPIDVIDIEEFQLLAVERVKLLRILEAVSARNSKETPFKDQVIEMVSKLGVKYFLPIVRGISDQEARRRDYLSHFILRLSYCRSEEYRRWFLARELEFFRLKFYNLQKKEEILRFMISSNLNYSPISEEEKSSISVELLNSTTKITSLDTCNFYKVPFTNVLDLVRSRRVLIKDGNAYVPYQDLISILSSIFRSQLSHSLSICAANLPTLESDERLAMILKGLHTSYTGNDFCVRKSNEVPAAAIDGLSKRSFPICMRSMYDTLKSAHHLRHGARQQFGLFLKGIGVPLEESMIFWREAFTQKADCDTEKFEKNYAYNIRHSYGKEGKRANYTPYSCMKVIMTSVGAGDNHGCPFRHSDAVNLRQKLQSYGLSIKDCSEVAELAARSHYQVACARYFEITHNVNTGLAINHPNQYFEESQKIIAGNVKGEETKRGSGRISQVKTEPRPSSEWGDESINLNLTEIEKQAKEAAESMDVDQ